MNSLTWTEVFPLMSGTLSETFVLFSSASQLPLLCLRVMENEEGRKEYLVFPPSKNQCPGSSQKGRKIPLKGNGRRIDYILYSDEGLQPDWKLVCFSEDLKTCLNKSTHANSCIELSRTCASVSGGDT